MNEIAGIVSTGSLAGEVGTGEVIGTISTAEICTALSSDPQVNVTVAPNPQVNVSVTGSGIRGEMGKGLEFHWQDTKLGVRVEGDTDFSYTDLQAMDAHYVHEQIQSAKVWDIMHGLKKYPSVTVVDSAGTVVVGEVIYINTNEIRLVFNAAFSGKAYLN